MGGGVCEVMMMASAGVLGGKRLLLTFCADHHLVDKTPPNSSAITAKRSSNRRILLHNKKQQQQQHTYSNSSNQSSSSSSLEPWLIHGTSLLGDDDSDSDSDVYLVDALLLLQKSILEKQWNLTSSPTKHNVTSSGTTARRRRLHSRTKIPKIPSPTPTPTPKQPSYYVKGGGGGGFVSQQQLLTHAQVVHLSQKIKAGLFLEDRRLRLKERLGCEPSDDQLATSLRITRANLHSTLIQSSLAREKLAMSNVRLVMSIAQRYDNMGAQMPDLIQGGLIGLLRGIEKFDSTKGFKISTYVYWWIRQGVSRALVDNSRTLRLPTHLHERLSLIRNAKARLEERGITPSIARIAETLNMSQKKVRNATEASSKVFSLDREAFPSLNGLPGETLHSYIADNRAENNPWNGVNEWALKDEVDKLIDVTLRERERDIIRLYYGLDNECLTWEDISRRIGLSRERVRQVGLVALEKLKHAARKKRLDAMLVQH